MKTNARIPSVSRRVFTTQLMGAAAGAFSIPMIPRASACCMVPKSYAGSISQKGQEAILFHRGDREELILRIEYQLKGDSAPDRFAWVITVPHEPDRYGVADGKLFEDMFYWAENTMFRKSRSRSKGLGNEVDSAVVPGIELGKRVQVGPYDIQPVRARGVEALDALNQWLAKNGFPTEDPAHMKYFVENKFTFLAIKISPPKGEKVVRTSGDVEPLHLSFKSERPYYPLRFSSRQGVFDLNLYVFTDKDLDFTRSAGALKKINHAPPARVKKNVDVKFASLPPSLRKQIESKADTGVKTQATWKANLVRTKGTNQGNTIASWDEDVFFAKA